MSTVVRERVGNSFPEGIHRARIVKVVSSVPRRYDRGQDLIEIELEGKEVIGGAVARASVMFPPVLGGRLLVFVEAALGRELTEEERAGGVDLEALIGKEVMMTVESGLTRYGYRFNRIEGFSLILDEG
jgi:hypothetical protein